MPSKAKPPRRPSARLTTTHRLTPAQTQPVDKAPGSSSLPGPAEHAGQRCFLRGGCRGGGQEIGTGAAAPQDVLPPGSPRELTAPRDGVGGTRPGTEQLLWRIPSSNTAECLCFSLTRQERHVYIARMMYSFACRASSAPVLISPFASVVWQHAAIYQPCTCPTSAQTYLRPLQDSSSPHCPMVPKLVQSQAVGARGRVCRQVASCSTTPEHL